MLTVFTNIKDENQYLESWLQHHINLGITNFVLFEDEGSKPHDNIVERYSGKNINIYLFKSVLKKDNTEFKDLTCLKSLLYNFSSLDWIIKLDPDEYLVIPDKWKNINEYTDYLESKGIYHSTISWVIFGANGYINTPTKGEYDVQNIYVSALNSIDNTKWKINISENTLCLGKAMAKLPFLQNSDLLEGISEAFPHVIFNVDKIYSSSLEDSVAIKHYMTKSFEEYYYRITQRGEYSPKWYRKLGDFFVINPDMIDKVSEIEKKFNIKIENIETKLNYAENNINVINN